MATIAIYFQGEKIAEHVIDKARLMIGRNADNDISLPDSHASGQHARISFEKNQYIVEDLMSTNGTFYRSEKVLRHVCREGDEIRIGEHILRFSELNKNPPTASGSKVRSNIAESLRQNAQEQTMFLETTGGFQSQKKEASHNASSPIIILVILSILAALGALVYLLLLY
jgi:pSer/pThr/pTyr-binding forkhead associated (FHA) protein